VLSLAIGSALIDSHWHLGMVPRPRPAACVSRHCRGLQRFPLHERLTLARYRSFHMNKGINGYSVCAP
jgi:hypothetical protein